MKRYKYECRTCHRLFDLPATLKQQTTFNPQPLTFPPLGAATYTNFSTTTIYETPCCPHCYSIEIEEKEEGKEA